MGVIGSGPHSFGFLAGNDLVFRQHTGVYGESDQQGVMGLSTAPDGTGVYGGSTVAKGGKGIGVRGETDSGVGVQGQAFGNGLAGNFIGPVKCSGDFDCGGKITTDDMALSGADCAEDFDVADMETSEPGTVMVVDDDGILKPCGEAYDNRVAGVISGAGEYKPGITLGKSESEKKRMPIGLVGRVYCKVDASYSSVRVGDLLTTSPTPGYAMKASDSAKALGAVIGKALRPLPGGQGLIPMLIALR
jgi:hypothetical protein